MVRRKLVKQVVMAVEALKSSRGVKRAALDNYLREHLGPQAPEQCRMAMEQALVEGLVLLKSGRYYPKPSETKSPAAAPSTSGSVGKHKSNKKDVRVNVRPLPVRGRGPSPASVERGRGHFPSTSSKTRRGRPVISNMHVAEEDSRSMSSGSRGRRRYLRKRRRSEPNFGNAVLQAWNSFWSPRREYKPKRKARKQNPSKMDPVNDVIYID